MMKEKKEKAFCWKTLKRAAGYLSGEAHGIFALTLVTALLNAVYPYAGILLSAEILTQLSSPARDREHILFLAALLVVINFVGRMLLDFCGQFLDVRMYTVMKHIERDVAAKAWRMDYAMSADPKLNETKQRIIRWAYDRGVLALVWQIREIFQACVTMGISVALAAEFLGALVPGEGRAARLLNHPGSVLLFLGLFALSIAYGLYTSARTQKAFCEADERLVKYSNQMIHLTDSCFEDYQNGKDIRLFQGAEMILRNLRANKEAWTRGSQEIYRYNRRMTSLSLLVGRLFHLAVYLFVGLKAIYGAFGVGSILKYTGVVTQLGDGITQFCDSIREFLQNFQYVKVYFDYLDMPDFTAAGELPVTEQIRENYEFEFRHVSYTYPGAASPSLRDISCRFRRGEKIAAVGRNGSGKTTFIKLLCRLCEPQEGEILLNGVDIRRYDYIQYLELFSTVFQDYQIFAFRLGENVAAESEYDRERAVKALEDAGFGERLAAMPQGLDTWLFKNFSEEGVELSGGESQKVAIARCLYKDAAFVVLDEPTAALDPVAEADIYQRMNQFTLDKGAIYISHRLSSCHFCDRILVFEQGRIVEQGTHESLIAAEGLYRRLWDAQAKYYV